MLVVEIAKHLDEVGIVTFDEAGITGDSFIGVLPPEPDTAVGIWPTGGPESSTKTGYDTRSFQIKVRGDRDPRTGLALAEQIYEALHGLKSLTLPDGTWLVRCQGIQSAPTSLGEDESGRHTHVLNFSAEIRNPTANRAE